MIKKALTYLIILTAMLYGLRWIHYQGLLRQKQGYYAKLTTAFCEKNEFDVLFLGSSRVEMHYNTHLFDSLTGRNSFNLGLQGATPQLALSALKIYLQKSSAPQKLYYEIDFHSLKQLNVIREFNNYFPYLSDPLIRQEFGRIDPRMRHFYYNPYYSFAYTGWRNISTGLHGWLNIPNKTDSLYFKGYLKEIFRPHLDLEIVKKENAYFNVNERAYVDSIITICKKNHIDLTLVTSPMFAGGKLDVANKQRIISQIRNVARVHKIPYHDFSSLSFCDQRTLFVDHFHMNHLGARKYTYFLTSALTIKK